MSTVKPFGAKPVSGIVQIDTSGKNFEKWNKWLSAKQTTCIPWITNKSDNGHTVKHNTYK